MKKKLICLMISAILLCQPVQVNAAETKPDTKTVSGNTLESDTPQETKSDENNADKEAEAKESDAQAEETASNETQPKESGNSVRDALSAPVGISSVVETKSKEDYVKAYEAAKNANWGYTNLGIANVSNNLNIRAIPAADGKLVGKLPKDAACEVLDSDGEWAHIKSGKVEGYVSCEYLLTGLNAKWRAEELVSTIATVTADSLRVRGEASTDADIITTVPKGEELEVVESLGDWIKVYLDDEIVYVFAEFVQVDAKLNTAITMTELLYGQGVSDVRVDLCQYAKQFLGNPYVWGGTSLTNGADCSGFVLSVYKKYGVSLPHYSGSQANCGTRISVSEAKPGDLVFYGSGQTINHVAIYIGNGQVIHASSPKTGIKISNVYYRTPLKAVRILRD
ncbi:MAG: NlpC/P60 family protein [Clostridiales bacterium]|nr:NlpC/P60 family protein [Clostridiales bacterium]